MISYIPENLPPTLQNSLKAPGTVLFSVVNVSLLYLIRCFLSPPSDFLHLGKAATLQYLKETVKGERVSNKNTVHNHRALIQQPLLPRLMCYSISRTLQIIELAVVRNCGILRGVVSLYVLFVYVTLY